MPFDHAAADPKLGVPMRHFINSSCNETFEAVAADTHSLLQECFRVRYQVYCKERGFVLAADHPDGLERDAYDDRSLHALLRYQVTGEVIGTVRLIPGAAGQSMPMYSVLQRSGFDMTALPPAAQTIEVSRFAISKEFRRRVGDAVYRSPTTANLSARRVIPHITLSLMMMIFRMSASPGIEYFCALMEPSLIRLLSRLGIDWQEIGPVVEYSGLRQPCVARIDEMAAAIAANRPDIWELMTNARIYRTAQPESTGAALETIGGNVLSVPRNT